MRVMIGKEWYGLFLVACVMVLTLVAWGWSRQPATETAPPALCGECGQIKGSDVCCAADAEKCGKCDLVKGSPGCCKIQKGTDTELCTGCGQIKGSEACCVAGAATCEKCGLHQGSPGCCRIKDVAAVAL